MIRLATAKDQVKILSYVNQLPCENLFISGDIIQFGFDQDFQKVWVEEEQDELRGVYLLYRTHLCIYVHDLTMDFSNLIALIETLTITNINVLQPIAQKLKQYFPKANFRDTVIAECATVANLVDYQICEKAQLSDLDELVELRRLCFEETNVSKETITESVKQVIDEFVIFMIKDQGKIVSMGYSNAQSDQAGMICSVCTHPDYRVKGYGSAVVSAIVADLAQHGKKSCLFFDNPKAASIYHKLGFKDVNIYTLITVVE